MLDIFSEVYDFNTVRRTIVLLNKLILKKPLLQSDSSHAISRQEKRWFPKSTARFPAKKR